MDDSLSTGFCWVQEESKGADMGLPLVVKARHSVENLLGESVSPYGCELVPVV